MMNMNIFRILGDVSHTASKCILIWAIHSNQSAEGVSLITQILYVAVFCTRYLDIFWLSRNLSAWNSILMTFYILSSVYIIVLMMKVYARTREREKAWKMGGLCAGGALILAPIVTVISKGESTMFLEVLWSFSIILESVCVLPQLLLLRQTTVPTVIDSFYLLTLGSYRAFYILNWIFRFTHDDRHVNPIAVVFGIVQTAFYADFAWVYWTRQRVKLRNGGVVDSDDLSRGWLVSRLLGRGGADLEEEQRATTNNTGDGSMMPSSRKDSRWGARGISVSADEGLLDPQPEQERSVLLGEPSTTDNKLADTPEDDDFDESDNAKSPT